MIQSHEVQGQRENESVAFTLGSIYEEGHGSCTDCYSTLCLRRVVVMWMCVGGKKINCTLKIRAFIRYISKEPQTHIPSNS